MRNINPKLRKNYEAYLKCEAKLLAEHAGKAVVFHDGKLIEVYEDRDQAYDAACAQFELGDFIIQVVGEKPISLGILTLNLTEGT